MPEEVTGGDESPPSFLMECADLVSGLEKILSDARAGFDQHGFKIEHTPPAPFLKMENGRWRVGTPDMRAPVDTAERRERVRKNLLSGRPVLDEQPERAERALICCYGPSLLDHLDEIRAAKVEGARVYTVSGAHDVLVANGIMPDCHVEMDPREHKAAFIRNWQAATRYFIATSCHDAMFDTLSGASVTVWNLFSEPGDLEFIESLSPGAVCIHIGSAVGLAAIAVALVGGHRVMDIYGMDCSYRDGLRHAGPHNGKVQKPMTVEINGRHFTTTPQMIAAARDFFALCGNIGQINLDLKGDGLLQHWVQSVIDHKEKANACST